VAAREGAAPGLALLAGIAFGIALWHLAGPVQGDALFHLGRIRKLAELGGLSLRAVDEFKDGGLHPGYAFPLWHGVLALVSRLAGVDPAAVVRHESSLLAPVLFLVTYEAGRALFRSAALAWAVLAAQLGLAAFAAGNGGALPGLALPATAAQYLLPAAALALVFRGRPVPLASLALGLALVHPTYALYLLLVLAGFLVVRAALAVVPLAGLARRSRWAAFVLGGTVPLLALALWPRLFVHFAHVVSISQARRAIGFLPLPYAFAGGAAVLGRLLGLLVVPLGLGA